MSGHCAWGARWAPTGAQVALHRMPADAAQPIPVPPDQRGRHQRRRQDDVRQGTGWPPGCAVRGARCAALGGGLDGGARASDAPASHGRHGGRGVGGRRQLLSGARHRLGSCTGRRLARLPIAHGAVALRRPHPSAHPHRRGAVARHGQPGAPVDAPPNAATACCGGSSAPTAAAGANIRSCWPPTRSWHRRPASIGPRGRLPGWRRSALRAER